MHARNIFAEFKKEGGLFSRQARGVSARGPADVAIGKSVGEPRPRQKKRKGRKIAFFLNSRYITHSPTTPDVIKMPFYFRPPRILIGCESSQAVCAEFRKLHAHAFSCDIEPCRGGHPEWHIQSDLIEVLSDGWDAIIAFPPCTYLCSSGMHWTSRGLRDPALTEQALEFVKKIDSADCPCVGFENSVGVLSTRLRKPDQIIQPWMFGDDASKATCLWLRGLPPLSPTRIVPPAGFYYPAAGGVRVNGFTFGRGPNSPKKPVWGNQTPSGQNRLGPSDDRARLRAITYPGVAKAMATQWIVAIFSSMQNNQLSKKELL